jgi:DNA-binding NarL/FixJ family response regulator
MLHVLVVDDHRLVAESLVHLLEHEPDIAVVGVVGSVREAQVVVLDCCPDIVLLDDDLPDGTGADLAVALKRDHPDVKLVMLTGDDDDSLLRTAIESGCVGLFKKTASASELVDALRSVGAGEMLFTPSSLVDLVREPDEALGGAGGLTAREREVLGLLVEGCSNAEIAGRLAMSINTVRNHNQAILRKLGVNSRLEAVAEAVRGGLVPPPGPRP